MFIYFHYREKFSGDSETHSSSDGRIGSDDSHENDECGEHQSMCTCEMSLDDLQSNASEQHVEQNQTKDCGRMVVEDNQGNQSKFSIGHINCFIYAI